MRRRKITHSESAQDYNTQTSQSFNSSPYSRQNRRNSKPKGKLYKSSFKSRAHTSTGDIEHRRITAHKPKSMIMIQRNNESVKYSLTDPKYRNPSIPCKFSSMIITVDKQRIEDPSKLGPGAYNPNKSLIMKN